MKWMKQAIALLLSVLLLISGTLNAFAQPDGTIGDTTVEVSPPAEAVGGCAECGATDGHTETCSLNTSNPPSSDDEESTEIPEDDNAAACAECGQTEGHLESCSQYSDPESSVCEECGEAQGHKEGCSLNEVPSEGEVFPEADPVDEHPCTCDYDAPENIAHHADSCGRKQYIKSQFEGKNAEDIYAQWETYNQATQTDLLAMLQIWDKTKYEALLELIEAGEEEPLDGVYYAELPGGREISIIGSSSAFPEGTTLSVKETSVPTSELSDAISNIGSIGLYSRDSALSDLYNTDFTVLGTYALDISFYSDGQSVQPAQTVTLNLTLPGSTVPAKANMVLLFHMSSNGPEFVDYFPVDHNLPYQVISAEVESFSVYVGVYVDGKYQSKLLKDYLRDYYAGMDSSNPEKGRYQVVSFPADLFNYDSSLFNQNFSGSNFKISSSNTGINDYQNGYAKQGILQEELVNGYPVINYSTTVQGTHLFDPTVSLNGKESYGNAQFEFVYDTHTGYYEYISAANHAQYNPSNNRVELYADSLAQSAPASNSAPYINAQSSNVSISADLYGGRPGLFLLPADVTVSPTLPGKDTFAVIYLNKIPTDRNDITIYITMTFDQPVDNEQIQFEFSNRPDFSNKQTIITDYSAAAGDSLEFSLQISNRSYSDGYLRIRPYYSSAWTNDNEKSFTIKEVYSERSMTSNQAIAGFYPFNDIATSVPNPKSPSYNAESLQTGGPFNYTDWSSFIKNPSSYSYTAMGTRALARGGNWNVDYHFSSVVEFDFYISEDNLTDQGTEIIYEFSGDDDLWVFVDGKLALDIGGGHGAIRGNINFTQGTAWVANAVNVTGFNSNDGNRGEKNSVLDVTQYEPGIHTMKIFYMERFGGSSNCMMRFNIPVIPSNALAVSKKVATESDQEMAVTPNDSFTFTLYAKKQTLDTAGNVTHVDTDFTVCPNAEYTMNGETFKTDGNGQFTLKHGQVAIFEETATFNEVKLMEADPNKAGGNVYSKMTVNVSGKEPYDCEFGKQTQAISMAGSDAITVAVVNKVDVTVYDLEIKKELIDEDQQLTGNPDFTFCLYLNNKQFNGKGMKGNDEYEIVNGFIQLKKDESIIIKNIPAGSLYYLREDLDDIEVPEGYQIDVTFSETLPGELEKDTVLTVTNTVQKALGNLTITKSGISELDHYTNNDDPEQSGRQSTIFTVTGPEGFSIQVVICGNSSVTIKDLPTGEYTVTENSPWSWRYDDHAPQTATVTGGETATAEFVNTRSESKWLSGDSRCENRWSNATARRKDDEE